MSGKSSREMIQDLIIATGASVMSALIIRALDSIINYLG